MPSLWEMDRARIGWWTMAFVLAFLVGYVLYSFLGTVVFGIFIYYATRPVYRRMVVLLRHRSLAAGASLVLVTLPAVLLLAYTVAIGLQELNRLIVMQNLDLGRIERLLMPYVDISRLVTDPLSLLAEEATVDQILSSLREATAYVGFLGSAVLHLFVMFVLAFYLLRDDHRLVAWFTRRFGDHDGVLEAYGERVDRDFSHVFFGNILNAFLTGIIGATAYGVLDYLSPAGLGIPYPTLLGLLTGIASLIPVLGIKLVYVPLAGYLFYDAMGQANLLWFPLLFAVVSLVVVDVIPDLVLRPYVSGRSLHLGMVMVSYVFGPLLFGWYGLFLGPMILVLVVHFAALVLPELVAGREIVPEAVGDAIGAPAESGAGEPEDGPEESE